MAFVTGKELFRRVRHNIRSGVDNRSEKLKPAVVAQQMNLVKDLFLDIAAGKIDRDQRYERWLSPIIHYDKELSRLKKDGGFDVFSVPSEVYSIVSCFLHADKEGCETGKKFQSEKMMLKSIDASRSSGHYKSSYAFEDSWRHLTADGLRVKHDNDFDITKCLISYMKEVPDIHFPSVAEKGRYEYIDGTIHSKDVGLNLGHVAHEIIVHGTTVSLRDNASDLRLTIEKFINTRKS